MHRKLITRNSAAWMALVLVSIPIAASTATTASTRKRMVPSMKRCPLSGGRGNGRLAISYTPSAIRPLFRIRHIGDRAIELPRLDLLRCGGHPRQRRHDQHVFGVDLGGRRIIKKKNVMFEHNRLSRAGILAIATEAAARHVDLVCLDIP